LWRNLELEEGKLKTFVGILLEWFGFFLLSVVYSILF